MSNPLETMVGLSAVLKSGATIKLAPQTSEAASRYIRSWYFSREILSGNWSKLSEKELVQAGLMSPGSTKDQYSEKLQVLMSRQYVEQGTMIFNIVDPNNPQNSHATSAVAMSEIVGFTTEALGPEFVFDTSIPETKKTIQ